MYLQESNNHSPDLAENDGLRSDPEDIRLSPLIIDCFNNGDDKNL